MVESSLWNGLGCIQIRGEGFCNLIWKMRRRIWVWRNGWLLFVNVGVILWFGFWPNKEIATKYGNRYLIFVAQAVLIGCMIEDLWTVSEIFGLEIRDGNGVRWGQIKGWGLCSRLAWFCLTQSPLCSIRREKFSYPIPIP